MQVRRSCALLAAFVVVAVPLGFAQEVGVPGQELEIAAWVKGEPVTLAEGKGEATYVIEFWQTTCSHSCAAIPYMTKMQQKYRDKGVVFVAVSGENLERVKAFVEERGAAMDYRVAVDQNHITDAKYRGRFRVSLLPYAFVVDRKGAVVWHGHPSLGLDKALGAILAGTYDLEARRRLDHVRGLLPEYFRMVRSASRFKRARPIGERILQEGGADAMLMNMLAWGIVAEPGLINRDLELAMRAAKAAYDASEGKHAGIMDTYARVLFDSGKKKEALVYQQKAIDVAAGEAERAELEKTLAKYKQAVGED